MKCNLCNKEFPENTKDFEIYLHFCKEHKEELLKTANNIKNDAKKQKINKDVSLNCSSDSLKDCTKKRWRK
jgi:hypothetical protein